MGAFFSALAATFASISNQNVLPFPGSLSTPNLAAQELHELFADGRDRGLCHQNDRESLCLPE